MHRILRARRNQLAVLGASVVSAFAVGATALAGGGGGNPAQHFDHVSNAGQPVGALSARDIAQLDHDGATHAVRRLGVRGPLTFFSAPSVQGGTCFTAGSGDSVTGFTACPLAHHPEPVFPSDERPILDFSVHAIDPNTGVDRVAGLIGFAADGVARVGILGTDGIVYGTPVQGNIYLRLDMPDVSAKALLAFDASGNEIYRDEYHPRTYAP